MADKKKKVKEKENVSKMTIDEKDLKAVTIPNPLVTGGIDEIGLKKISPILIPKYLLMHPALPRGIEIKANRMIRLVSESLDGNIFKNNREITKNGSLFKGKDRDALSEEAKNYCKRILYDSGGPLYLKQLATGAYRFGTSFSVLQTNVAENEVLKFEYQDEIFFGPAKYPKQQKGPGINWGDIPMVDRKYLAGKRKINPKTKRIAKYTQLTKKYPERYEDNFKFYCSEYVNTRTHPAMKEQSPGELVPVGQEIDESHVIQLAFDTMGDDPLGIPLVQFLQLTITYLVNMERAGAQTMVNFGFNKWVANTPFKNEIKMKDFGKSLANLQKDSIIILPELTTLKNIEPGTTEFDKVHPIYMRLIAIRLGIPMPLLTQSGTETNKATIGEMRKDMYDDFIADELTIERTINEGFFKACQIKWGKELTIAELDYIVPKFKFDQPPEDKDIEQKRELDFSLSIRNYAMVGQMWGGNKFWEGDPSVTNLIALKTKSLVLKNLGIGEKEIEDLVGDGIIDIKKIKKKKKPTEQKPIEEESTDETE